jgi:plastocyanin
MRFMRFAGVSAFSLALVAGGGFAATAQDASSTSFSAAIVSGTCAALEQPPVVQLADLTYGLGEEAGTGATAETMEMIGAPETAPVATGVTRLELTAAEIIAAPHAVAVFAAGGVAAEEAVACGGIGGIAPEGNLFFGLQEQNDSGYAGVGWLNETGGTTLLTVMLTSLEATSGAAGMAQTAATPAAATPVTTDATPEAMAGMATPDTMAGMASPVAATPAAGAAADTGAGAAGATPAASPVAAASPIAEASPVAAAGGDAAAETVTIESVDIDFIPAEVTIPADTDVTIELPNNGVTLHSFVINEKNNEDVPNLDIYVEMAPGATEQAIVNAPAGEYYYWCDVPGHEPAGMFGTMIVE